MAIVKRGSSFKNDQVEALDLKSRSFTCPKCGFSTDITSDKNEDVKCSKCNAKMQLGKS